MLARLAVPSILLIAAGCSQPLTLDIDVVVTDGVVELFACEQGTLCRRDGGHWWPKLGECTSVSDVYLPAAGTLDCLDEIGLRQADGIGEFALLGCGHNANIAVDLPSVVIDEAILSWSDATREVSVDYQARGADVAVLTAGNWTSTYTCASVASGRSSQYSSPAVESARLGAYDLIEQDTDFGHLRVWVGTQVELEVPGRQAPGGN